MPKSEISYAGPPTSGTHSVDDYVVDPAGTIWSCMAAGTPGTFASASAGSDTDIIAESQVTSLVTDLAAKAPLASPGLTGSPTAPTQTAGDNSSKIATSAFVATAVAIAPYVPTDIAGLDPTGATAVSYTHLRAHET